MTEEPHPTAIENPVEHEPQPPTEKRMVGAWVFLWLLVAFLVSSQLVDYFQRGSEQSIFNAKSFDDELKQIVLLRTAAKDLDQMVKSSQPTGDSKPQDEETESEKQYREGIEKLINRVAVLRTENLDAATYYVVLRHELDRDIPFATWDQLATSKEKRVKVLESIYRDDRLTQKEAEDAKALWTGRTSLARLVRTHIAELRGDNSVRSKEFPTGSAIATMAVTGSLCVLIPVGMVVLIVYSAQNRAGKFANAQHPAGHLSMARADRYILRALISFFAQGLLAGVIAYAITSSGLKQPGLASTLGYAVALLTVFALFASNADRLGISLRNIGVRKDQLAMDVAWGFGGYLANLPILMFTMVASMFLFRGLPSPEHPVTEEILRSPNIGFLLGIFFMGAIVAPIIEEITFRGLMTPALESLFKSTWTAIIVNGLVFAAIHPTGIPAWPSLAMIGIIAARLTYIRQSLIPAIVMHAVHNFTLLLFTAVMAQG